MERKYLQYGGAAVIISILVYFKLLILAAAVAVATLWKTNSNTDKVPQVTPTNVPHHSKEDIHPYGSAFWANQAADDTDQGQPTREDVSSMRSNSTWNNEIEIDEDHHVFENNMTAGEVEISKKSSCFTPETVNEDTLESRSGDSGAHGRSSEGRMERKGKDGKANPRQVYVGGLPFKTEENNLRNFFSEFCGSVEQVKLLRQQDGKSKGVAFLTFSHIDGAQKALQLHDTDYHGRTLTVRIANPTGGKADKGDRGEKGDRNFDRGNSNSFVGKGLQTGKGSYNRQEMDRLIQDVLTDDTPLELGDFDFQARKLLTELRNRDKLDGTTRCNDAIQSVKQFCSSKRRSGVRNWKAYVYTLLGKCDPELAAEMKSRERQERAAKGKPIRY